MKKSHVKAEEIITLDKLAEEVGLTKDTMEVWRGKGMPTIKIGKYLRVYRPHVYEWIVDQGEALEKEERQMGLFKGKKGEA